MSVPGVLPSQGVGGKVVNVAASRTESAAIDGKHATNDIVGDDHELRERDPELLIPSTETSRELRVPGAEHSQPTVIHQETASLVCERPER